MCSLNGDDVPDGYLEYSKNGSNLEVTLKCPGSLTGAQQSACSGSATNNSPITCESGGCSVSGVCEKMCCSSCGSSVSLGQCVASGCP
jgi:hypothetical protein